MFNVVVNSQIDQSNIEWFMIQHTYEAILKCFLDTPIDQSQLP